MVKNKRYEAIAKLELLAQSFVDEFCQNNPQEETLSEAYEILRQNGAAEKPAGLKSLYQNRVDEFKERKGDIASYIGLRLKTEDLERITKYSKGLNLEKLSPEDVMKQVVCPAIPYETLAKRIKGRLSKQQIHKKLVKDYSFESKRYSNPRSLKGAYTSLIYALLIENFRFELADKLKKFYEN